MSSAGNHASLLTTRSANLEYLATVFHNLALQCVHNAHLKGHSRQENGWLLFPAPYLDVVEAGIRTAFRILPFWGVDSLIS